MPGWLFLAWAAYDEVEPIGGRRLDWNTAAVLARYTNRHRNTHLFPKPIPVRDFLLDFDYEARQQSAAPVVKKAKSPAELLSVAKNVAGMYNRDNEKRRAREQERTARRMNAKPMGHGRRTR